MAKNHNIIHLDVDKNLDKYLGGKTLSYLLTHKTLDRIPSKQLIEILSIKTQSVVDKKALTAFPNLKLLITRTAGFDHIDLDTCKDRGIAVYRIPNYGAYNIGEHALALLLAGSRGIVRFNANSHKGIYDYREYLGLTLHGKTIGIIGTGKIGLSFAHVLQGLDAKLLAYDVFLNKKAAKKYNFSYVPLNKLLEKSDAVSIHVPLIPQTKHMIGSKELRKMKKGSILINTSRGAVIDEEALLRHAKKFKAVCLDVITDEKNFSKSHPLLKYDNVILTPHSAFYTDESVKTIAKETLANIQRFQKGDKTNRVV